MTDEWSKPKLIAITAGLLLLSVLVIALNVAYVHWLRS